MLYFAVPAHTGGADLSNSWFATVQDLLGPRPHGRGGFKCVEGCLDDGRVRVPAHTGGADLSVVSDFAAIEARVPAHTGGADLSNNPLPDPAA